jgi:hypothetical protein
MQYAVDAQMSHVFGHRLALVARFPGYNAEGKRDVAQ